MSANLLRLNRNGLLLEGQLLPGCGCQTEAALVVGAVGALGGGLAHLRINRVKMPNKRDVEMESSLA